MLWKLLEPGQQAYPENLEMLVKQAISAKPNRKWYSVSKDGLLEASQFVKDFGVSMVGTLGSLDKLVWPA